MSYVPKFSSFKPKARPVANNHPDPSSALPQEQRQVEVRSTEHNKRQQKSERGVSPTRAWATPAEIHGARRTDLSISKEDSRHRGSTKRHRSRSRSRDGSRKVSRHVEKERDKGRHRGHREHREHREHRSKRSPSRPSPNPRPENLGLDEGQQSYFIDRRGDTDNLKYGLYQRNIPPYKRFGSGYVLGLPGHLRIDRDASDKQWLVIQDDRKSGRIERLLTSRRNRPKDTWDQLVKREVSNSENTQAKQDDNPNFIPVPSQEPRDDDDNMGPLDIPENEVDYRSIEGKAKPKPVEATSENMQHNPVDPGDEDQDEDKLVKQRNVELSRRTKSEPKNLDAWLDFINHQTQMASLGRGARVRNSDTPLGHSELRSIASIKISIYEQALEAVGNNQDKRVKLLLGMLEEGSRIWDESKQSKKWQEALTMHPESIDLWTKHLDFVQTGFRRYRYADARNHFFACLRILSEQIRQPAGTNDWRKGLEKIHLYIVTRLLSMAREAGYYESSIASWQLLFEYTFYRPSQLCKDNDAEVLQSLEEFWESEVPRIGEENARGWSNYNPQVASPPPGRMASIGEKQRPGRPIKSFFDEEMYKQSVCQRPGRTVDDDFDDPDHVVLFSDVSEFLSVCLYDMSQAHLLEGFLLFAALPPLSSLGQPPFLPFDDPFLRSGFFESDRPKDDTDPTSESGTAASSFSSCLQRLACCPLKKAENTTEDLFGGGFAIKESQVDLNFIKGLLGQISLVTDDERICEYFLAFLTNFYPAEAARAAKTILGRMPSSIRLYNSYGLIERSRGNVLRAAEVFSAALKMSKTFPREQQHNTILVLRTYVWETLRMGETAKAYEQLLSFMSPDSPGEALSKRPAAILKARQLFTEGRDNSLSNNRFLHAILHTECLALLNYFKNGSDITSALEIFHRTSDLLAERKLTNSTANELNHQALANLLEHHLSHQKMFKPSIIRDELSKSIVLFPNNTKFLALFAANEARFRIDDRVRTILRDVVLQHDEHSSIIGWCFAIFAEKQRGAISGSTQHSVRALYERAVESQAGKHSLALWKSFVEFEINVAKEAAQRLEMQLKSDRQKSKKLPGSDLKPFSRVKQVYFRGLTRLPWCKNYMMMAFGPTLRDVMGVDELKKVWHVMMEKELRVFGDLDPVFEVLEREDAGAMSIDEDGAGNT